MNNISIISDLVCTGCTSCLQACPKSCISLKNGVNGFLYPTVNEKECIQCKKCLKVCPAHNEFEAREPLKCFVASNIDDNIRLKSSSGGVFIELAKYVISHQGIVYGAIFDKEWNVHHVSASIIEEVYPMMGSKYVQSNIGNTFIEVKKYLNNGREVLYTGTPCQIAGLYRFLGKNYPNLLTMDFSCHGVPSNYIWHKYLNEAISKNGVHSISEILFRDKSISWDKYCFVVKGTYSNSESPQNIIYDIHYNNPYMKGFLNDLYLRKSCYNCPSKSQKSHSDITIGDYWGVVKQGCMQEDHKKGISLLLINTEKAKTVFNIITDRLNIEEISYADAIKSNENLLKPTHCPFSKVRKFNKLIANNTLVASIEKTLKKNIVQKKWISLLYKLGIKK